MKRKVLGILVTTLALATSCSIHQEMIELSLKQPNLSEIEDGTYPGSFENHRWYCHVEVEIISHSYDTIKVLNSANGGNGLYEKLVAHVLEQQSIEVDAVSGATISSNTFLKAVENALE